MLLYNSFSMTFTKNNLFFREKEFSSSKYCKQCIYIHLNKFCWHFLYICLWHDLIFMRSLIIQMLSSEITHNNNHFIYMCVINLLIHLWFSAVIMISLWISISIFVTNADEIMIVNVLYLMSLYATCKGMIYISMAIRLIGMK